MLKNQYLLSLGEFSMDGFNEHPLWFLCLLFFTLATLFSQIVILNMLIAIMGNTFDMVIERRHEYSMQTKLNIMGEYCYVVSNNNRFITRMDKDKKKFLVVVRPELDEEEKED